MIVIRQKLAVIGDAGDGDIPSQILSWPFSFTSIRMTTLCSNALRSSIMNRSLSKSEKGQYVSNLQIDGVVMLIQKLCLACTTVLYHHLEIKKCSKSISMSCFEKPNLGL